MPKQVHNSQVCSQVMIMIKAVPILSIRARKKPSRVRFQLFLLNFLLTYKRLHLLHQAQSNRYLPIPEQLHQDVQVQRGDVPAAEPARAVPAARQLLLPVPAGAAAHPGHLLADADHHRHPAHWRTRLDRGQRRLRRFRKFTIQPCILYFVILFLKCFTDRFAGVDGCQKRLRRFSKFQPQLDRQLFDWVGRVRFDDFVSVCVFRFCGPWSVIIWYGWMKFWFGY